MPESLSAADRSSLQSERGPVNMSVGGLMVFERGDGTRYEAVADLLRRRLHLVPRYRQKLEDMPLGLAGPVWVDDAGFDLYWHLRSASLPADADEREALAGYVAREMSRRLDRSRPLWEVHVIEGLHGGRRAIWVKMHHALVDGLAAIGIGLLLLDPTMQPAREAGPSGEEWTPQRSSWRTHLQALAREPLTRAQRLLLDSAQRALDTSPRRAAEDLLRATELVSELARTRPQAPMTPLNHSISPNRRFAMLRTELAPLKAAGRANGGTVNDVLLAAVAGMLGEYLERAAVDLEGREPVALVPVSIRREEEAGELGNRISTVFVDLPASEPDPAARVRAVARATTSLRESAAVHAGAMIAGATGQVPPLVSSMLVRAIGNVRAMNLVVSNLPGPQQPFFLNGVRLREVYPAVPLNPANQGLTVGILSYDGRVHVGMLADARLSPGVDVAATALDRTLAELAGAG
jgi:WS/DGAT/MGAT family acyltransferase